MKKELCYFLGVVGIGYVSVFIYEYVNMWSAILFSIGGTLYVVDKIENYFE